MRLTAIVLTAIVSLPLAASPVSASPLGIDPPTTSTFGWADNESRAFTLAKVGSSFTLSVAGVGTSQYGSLDQCCTDVFSRVLDLFPLGSTLHFTRLALNTMPVQTEFWDDLNLTELKRAGLDNLGTLTGLVTLDVPDGVARTARFTGDGPLEPMMEIMSAPTEQIPEPSTLLLVGGGLLGLARVLRRRA